MVQIPFFSLPLLFTPKPVPVSGASPPARVDPTWPVPCGTEASQSVPKANPILELEGSICTPAIDLISDVLEGFDTYAATHTYCILYIKY